jgi:Ca-activated chloride channel family protein
VRLVYDDLTDDPKDCCSGKLMAWMTPVESRASELDPLVAGRVSRSNTTAALRDANQLFDSGKVGAANAKLNAARKAVRANLKGVEPAAPVGRLGELQQDFNEQLAALDDAHRGFNDRTDRAPRARAKSWSAARPMATSTAPPHRTRAGRAQVRSNEDQAFRMSL